MNPFRKPQATAEKAPLTAVERGPYLTIVVGLTLADIEATAAAWPSRGALRIRFPETGLHPREVARYAAHLAGWLVANGAAVVVLTMSEAFVNQVCRCVRAKVFPAANIAIVGRHEDGDVFSASVEETGALKDWPFGFLAPIGGLSLQELASEDGSKG